MRRVDAPEILDSGDLSQSEVQAVLGVIGSVNRRFGGIATTQKLVEQAAQATGMKRLSLLEVAAGLGDVPETVSPAQRKPLGRRKCSPSSIFKQLV
jgi:hypothetical protein